MTVNDIDGDHWIVDGDAIVVKLALNQNVCLSNAEAVCVNTVHLMVGLYQLDVDLVHVHPAIPVDSKEEMSRN